MAYMSLIYESTSLVRLCVAGAMFLVVAFVYLMIRRKKIKCRINAPITLVDANKTINLRVMVRNNSRMITDKIKLQIRYSDTRKIRKNLPNDFNTNKIFENPPDWVITQVAFK